MNKPKEYQIKYLDGKPISNDPCLKIEEMNVQYPPEFLSSIKECPLDDGIEYAVMVFQAEGIETYESCEGGVGHAFYQPTVRFHGERSTGLKAFAIAQEHGLHIDALRRVWDCIDGELIGATWEITFIPGTVPVSAKRDLIED